jgi:nitrogen-specific signal transduction histidine kinase
MIRVELVTAWDLMKLMPSMGGMSAGIVHEINQPLNAIKMGSEFLSMMISQKADIRPAQVAQIAGEISDQVDRASEIINRLSAFGRRPDFKKELININEPVRDVMAIVDHQMKVDNIAVELDLGQNLPPVRGHKSRLAQVVYNLVLNAAEAIDARKKLPDDDGRQRERRPVDRAQLMAPLESTAARRHDQDRAEQQRDERVREHQRQQRIGAGRRDLEDQVVADRADDGEQQPHDESDPR